MVNKGKGELMIVTQILKAISCSTCSTLHHLRQLHARATVSGLPLISHHLIAAFLSFSSTKPHSLHYSLSLFKLIRNPTTFSYNTLIRAHTLSSSPLAALRLFRRLCRQPHLSPDFHSFPFALSACSRLAPDSLSAAKSIHSMAFKLGFLMDTFVINGLIKVYSVSGSVSEAYRVLDECPDGRDVVSYNTLIGGFVKSGDYFMARKVFNDMPERDSVSWSTMLAGYAQRDRSVDAVRLFSEMIDSGAQPDNVALVSALSACAQLGDLERGKFIRAYIDRNRVRYDSFITTGLVDFYSKCGSIEEAKRIFNSNTNEKSLCTWNAMIVGLAIHGLGEQCISYFHTMTAAGIEPDGVTFLGVLSGCSHAGLVAEAKEVFDKMESHYKTPRELKHYGCMADMLGRAGMIGEARAMIETMPMRGDVNVWGGLLGGCRVHGDIGMATEAAERVVEVKPEDGGVYSVMAGVYAVAGRWEEVARVREAVEGRRDVVKKKAGCSWVSVGDGVTHEFVAGDTLHPLTRHIYLVIHSMERHQFGS